MQVPHIRTRPLSDRNRPITRLPLAPLTPRIQTSILIGSIGTTVTADSVVRADLPSDWKEQERRLYLLPE